MAKRLVEHAKEDDHANSLCHALVYAACPIALWIGNLDIAEQYIDLLHETSSRLPQSNWHPLGRAYRGVLLIKRGDLQVGLPRLRAAAGSGARRLSAYVHRGAGRSPLPRAGLGGLATVEEAIDRAARTGDGWKVIILRVKGELLRLDSMDAAEDCFRQALQLARTQDALFWELRAAMSLATLHRALGHSAEAIACLRPIYDRFTEGFDTADLIAAKRLLDELSDPARH
jgi:hypothetical protein